jgi:hypothetical protein
MEVNTYFASPERHGKAEISEGVMLLSSETALLNIPGPVSGLTAVLNEKEETISTVELPVGGLK